MNFDSDLMIIYKGHDETKTGFEFKVMSTREENARIVSWCLENDIAYVEDIQVLAIKGFFPEVVSYFYFPDEVSASLFRMKFE